MPLSQCKPALDVGNHADADDHEVAIEYLTVRARDCAHGVAAAKLGNLRVTANTDAGGGMILRVELGHLRAYDAAHDTICRFEHGNVDAELTSNGGDFETNVSRTDDHEARAGTKATGDRIDVVDRP
jgi:hypothetical protein